MGPCQSSGGVLIYERHCATLCSKHTCLGSNALDPCKKHGSSGVTSSGHSKACMHTKDHMTSLNLAISESVTMTATVKPISHCDLLMVNFNRTQGTVTGRCDEVIMTHDQLIQFGQFLIDSALATKL